MPGNKPISRRQFLIGSAAVSIAACGGLGYLSLKAPTIQFMATHYPGIASSTPKILIVYASRCGSTGGVADAIAQAFHEHGAEVDVKLIHDTYDVVGYNAVVVGAPIYMSKSMPEAKDFIAKHRTELGRLRTAYFLTCMTLAKSHTDEQVNEVKGELEKVIKAVPEVSPVALGCFAGALDFDKMALAMQLLYKAGSGGGVTAGDFRDFLAIRRWASQLYPTLVPA